MSALSGFHVSYGPVRAADIPEYLASGCRKTPPMREVRFGLGERLRVAPVELVRVLPYAAGVLVVTAFVGLIRDRMVSPARALRASLPVWGAMAAGSLLLPLVLPLLPGKAFSLKGALLGLLWAAASCLIFRPGALGIAGYLLFLPAVTAFLAMSFTGSTTFTSLSGVNAEVRVATPLIIAAAAAGAVLTILSMFIGGAP